MDRLIAVRALIAPKTAQERNYRTDEEYQRRKRPEPRRCLLEDTEQSDADENAEQNDERPSGFPQRDIPNSPEGPVDQALGARNAVQVSQSGICSSCIISSKLGRRRTKAY